MGNKNASELSELKLKTIVNKIYDIEEHLRIYYTKSGYTDKKIDKALKQLEKSRKNLRKASKRLSIECSDDKHDKETSINSDSNNTVKTLYKHKASKAKPE